MVLHTSNQDWLALQPFGKPLVSKKRTDLDFGLRPAPLGRVLFRRGLFPGVVLRFTPGFHRKMPLACADAGWMPEKSQIYPG